MRQQLILAPQNPISNSMRTSLRPEGSQFKDQEKFLIYTFSDNGL